ncbi:hypothetical protein FX985_05771 [Pseudomonas extremaustralis]|uniref:DUF4760 domain-containing protein n=1 Tax=Pseudomonas extremaustralis TaxID=359110 RepID=A0A5M9IRL0_9PSED|nr:hypothetical protein [Pseudomonas extremaustralis]KAA8559394.1 hypothetical protein FX985_05771 [Pseudomonas extremaustralis]
MDTPSPQDLAQYIQTLKQLKEITTVNNPWIPLWAAIAGGLIASIPTGIGAIFRSRSTRKSVEVAILTEIANMALMIRKRNYVNQLIERRNALTEINNQIASVHNDCETLPNRVTQTFEVTVSDDYCKIYKANLDKIGIINSKKLSKIVNFYSLVESVMLDAKPTGNMGTTGSVEDYAETIIFLEDALKLADELNPQRA